MPASADIAAGGASAPLRMAVGIEDTFVPQARPGRRPLDEYELTGHDERWPEDFALAARTGATMIRYGLPWHRCNPAPGELIWDDADRRIDTLLEHGLEPIIDLVHYGCPLWLEGTFADAAYPDAVEAWAAAVADRYGDRVRWFTPVNEPMIHALLGGFEARWPPERRGDAGFVEVALSIARGLVRSQHAIKARVADAVSCHVEASFRHVGDAQERRLLDERRWLFGDLVTGRVDQHHALAPWLIKHGAEDLGWFLDHRSPPDVVGVNYYPHLTTRHVGAGGTLGAFAPGGSEGLSEVLRAFAERYGTPVFVTETSVVGTVAERQRWLRDSLEVVHRLRSEGVPIVGYTWWPLFSLVDWDWREGDGPASAYLRHMGLADLVDDGDGGFAVEPTAVLETFRQMATTQEAVP